MLPEDLKDTSLFLSPQKSLYINETGSDGGLQQHHTAAERVLSKIPCKHSH